jgi:O-antigen ligase
MAANTIPISAQRPVLGSNIPIVVAGLGCAVVVGLAAAVKIGFGIGALVGVLFVPVVMLNVPFGVLAWIPAIFVERVPAFSFGPTLIAFMVAAAWLLALPATRGHVAEVLRRHRFLFTMLALLLVWTTVSILWASDRGEAASHFVRWYTAGAAFLIVATVFSTRRLVIGACVAFVLGATLSVLVGFVPGDVAIRGDINEDEAARLAGSLGDPNFLAAGVVPAIALTFGLMSTTRRPGFRWALAGALVILAGGLVATGSRGGLIAIGVMAIAAVSLERGRRLQLGVLVVTMVAVAGLLTAYTSSASIDRLRDFETSNGRVDLWGLAINMTEDNPVNGVGINNYRAEAVQYLQEPGFLEDAEFLFASPHVAHNTYLQQLAETGVVGVGLLLAVFGAAVAATGSGARAFLDRGDGDMAALGRALLVAQLGVLTTSMFMSNGPDERIWVLLALGVALASVAFREEPA